MFAKFGRFISQSVANNFFLWSCLSYVAGLIYYPAEILKDGRAPFYFLEWKMTQYHINFIDFGFVKRGIVGTILYPIFALFEDGSNAEYLIVFLLDVVVCLAIIYIVAQALKPKEGEGDGALSALRLLLVFSPLGYMALAYDVGRYDHIAILCGLISIALLRSDKVWASALVMSLGILNHEGLLFYGVPLIVGYQLVRTRKIEGSVIALVVPTVLAGAAVALLGNSDIDPAAVLAEEVAAGAAVWSRGLFEPQFALPPIQYVIFAFYTAVPYLLLFWFYSSNGLKKDMLFLAPFVPLTMFALGVDYARWAALIMFCVSVVIFLQAKLGKNAAFTYDPVWRKIIFIAALIPLGPVGIETGLPYLTAFVKIIGLV